MVDMVMQPVTNSNCKEDVDSFLLNLSDINNNQSKILQINTMCHSLSTKAFQYAKTVARCYRKHIHYMVFRKLFIAWYLGNIFIAWYLGNIFITWYLGNYLLHGI
jgi:hypothetical protein